MVRTFIYMLNLQSSKSRIVQNHMSCHLSRPTHLGTWPKTSMGMDKESTMYHQGTQFAIGPFLGAGTLKLNLPHRWGWGWGKIF